MLAPPKRVGFHPIGAFLRCPYPVAPSALFRAHRACPHCGQMWVQFIPLLPFALKSAPLDCPCYRFFVAAGSLKDPGWENESTAGRLPLCS